MIQRISMLQPPSSHETASAFLRNERVSYLTVFSGSEFYKVLFLRNRSVLYGECLESSFSVSSDTVEASACPMKLGEGLGSFVDQRLC